MSAQRSSSALDGEVSPSSPPLPFKQQRYVQARAANTQAPWQGLESRDIDGLYEQAMRHHREGQPEAALELYSRVILADEEHAEAHYGRALAYYALGNCDQAINDCHRAIELRRRFVEAHLLRGAAYWGKAAIMEELDPFRIGLCEQTISDCTYVLDAAPHHAKAHFHRGLAYMALGNKAMAKYDLENAVALLADPLWKEEAENWLSELKKPRLLSKYERQTWHNSC